MLLWWAAKGHIFTWLHQKLPGKSAERESIGLSHETTSYFIPISQVFQEAQKNISAREEKGFS